MKRLSLAAVLVFVLTVHALGAIRCSPSVWHTHWHATCADSVEIVLKAAPANFQMQYFGESAGSAFDIVLDFGNGQVCRRTIHATLAVERFNSQRW